MKFTLFLRSRPALLPGILFALICFGVFTPAQAQTCAPRPPEANALRICWPAVNSRSDGTVYPAGTRVVYEVQRQSGSTWTSVATTDVTTYLATNLAPGSYTFRVLVHAEDRVSTGVGSVSPTRTIDSQAPPANAGPVVIAVVISSDRAPAYRVTGTAARPARGELFALVPVGRPCTGPVLFRYRDASFRRVNVNPDELYGTSNTADLAAPCATPQA